MSFKNPKSPKNKAVAYKNAACRAAALLAALLTVMLLSGCINTAPKYYPSVTPGPTAAPTEEQTAYTEPPAAEATEEASPEPTVIREGEVDAMGNRINGAEHYIRYISFRDLVVYEEEGDTFLDGVIVNSYSQPLVCAVDIVYRDEGGGELARAQLQTGDGNYMLVLAPGDNLVYATILTDSSLLEMEYTLEFDSSTGVHPE